MPANCAHLLDFNVAHGFYAAFNNAASQTHKNHIRQFTTGQGAGGEPRQIEAPVLWSFGLALHSAEE